MTFNDQPTLVGETLILRGLTAEDYKALYEAAKDPETWAGHPANNRHEEAIFAPYFQGLLQAGGTLVVIDCKTDQIIGCSRYYVGPDAPNDIGIGFTFLNHLYWGGDVNFQMKRLMLSHAFETFDSVWFHIAPTNIRSQKATAKLGAVFVGEADLDLSNGPARWFQLRLDKDAWFRVCELRERG